MKIQECTNGEVTAASLLGLTEPPRPKRGLREEPEAFGAAERLTVSIHVSADQIQLLESAGVDVKSVARTGAEKAIKDAEAKAWAETNRDAINAYNAWIEEHGTLAEQLGLI